MAQIHEDFALYRRNSKVVPLQFRGKNRRPFPIVGYDILFILKTNFDDADADAKIIKKTAGLTEVPAGSVDQIENIDDGTEHYTGKARLKLSASDMDIEPGLLHYAVELTKESEDFRETFEGRIRIKDTLAKGTNF